MTELQIIISKLHPEDDLKQHSEEYWKGFEACKKEAVKLIEAGEEPEPKFCPYCQEEL